MISLSDADLDDFQQAYPWFTGSTLPDGRILGNPARLCDEQIIQTVARHLDITKESTLIELACAEGALTVQLAPLVKRLVALEIRPRNVCALLTRLFVHDIHNVQVRLEEATLANPAWGKYDILFHAGLLYHLSNPVAHLLSLKGLAPQMLLDTHYYTEDLRMQRGLIEHAGQHYPSYVLPEQGWADPFGSIGPVSHWLKKEQLLQLLHDIGYNRVEVVRDFRANGAPRFTVIAKQ